MCGIVGYLGHREAFPVLIKGLKRLEYRGYDSVGVALMNHEVKVYKKQGKVSDLELFTNDSDVAGSIGIGHTRWATHGEPSDINSHPQESMKRLFIIVHNGIIENYTLLKCKLAENGYTFRSDTDTEVIANLIEYIYMQEDISAEVAIRLALPKLVGAYGLLIICRNEPNRIYAVRKGSPLVIGIGENEYFMASDTIPIAEYTSSVIYMNNDNIAIISHDGLFLKTVDNIVVSPEVSKIAIGIDEIEKNGFDHYMLKEIFEQPGTILDTIRGRITRDHKSLQLGGLLEVLDRLKNAKRLIIVGSGTSWHAGLVGEYLIEDLARIPVEVEYSSEFRYRNPVIFSDDIVIAISQSGETADTIAAVNLARSSGALVLGISNVVGSSIPRLTSGGIYTHAGVEIGVASTKAFTAQVSVLAMIAIHLAHLRGTIEDSRYHSLIDGLASIPEKIQKILLQNDAIKNMAGIFKNVRSALYLGRGYFFPVALEGALKLKEISYIHAEGYPAAEMKHGPIALVDKDMPVIVIATRDKFHDKIVSNIQEIKARGGVVLAIVTENDKLIKKLADHVLEIPEADPVLSALVAVIPLQLLSYHAAIKRGCNVDQPRNLAKSVTVE
jgi:glucosamine--fructose-6-phosphate aminotransferase (isomerizing)